MKPLATLSIEQEPAATVVRLAGEIDMSNATTLEQAAKEAVGDATAVVVDLCDVTFLDSAGVRLLDHLVGAWEAARRLRVVVCDDGPVRFTLRLCDFPDRLLSPSRADALVAVQTAG